MIMKFIFIQSLNLLIINALVAVILTAFGFKLNPEHLELLFIFISYTLLIIGLIHFNMFNHTGFSKFDLVILGTLIFWFLINIFRSVDIPAENLSSLPRYLGGRYYTPAYLVPLFAFLGGNITILSSIWNYSKKLIYLFLILTPLLFLLDTSRLLTLVGFFPLVFLNQEKLSLREKVAVNTALIIYMLFSIWKGNRTEFATLAFYFILASLISNKNKFKSELEIRIRGFILILFLVSGFIYMYTGNLSKHFTDPTIVENIQSYEMDKFNLDSRDLVFTDFSKDFNDPKDLIFGRGVLGTTYSPQFIVLQKIYKIENNIFKFPVGYRLEIENGYLQLILKSGILGLLLFIVVSFRAIYLGLFKSENSFTAICAFIIIERFLSMIGFSLPSYTPDYILFWLCLGFCLSENIRSLTNIQMFFMLRGFKYYKPKFIRKKTNVL